MIESKKGRRDESIETMKKEKHFLTLLLVCAWPGVGTAQGAAPGAVVAWGANSYGETTVPVEAQSGVTAISAGSYHSVAIVSPILPVVITQPLSQTVVTGATVNLSVTVNGAPPFSYQWRFNGGNLAGSTNAMLVLTGVNTSQSGNYSVGVNNLAGSTTSSNAIVSVIDSAEILYVSNIGDNTIRKFDSTGRDLGTLAHTLNGAFALATDGAGNVYTAEVNNSTMVKFVLNPLSQTVNVGQRATFTMTAAGIQRGQATNFTRRGC